MARVFRISKMTKILQISYMQQADSRASRTLLNRRTIKQKGSVTATAMIKKREEPSCWVPHPSTGIYYPLGHERIMDDVPKSAASFGETYWLRNIDGVDKPAYDNDKS